MQGVRKNLISTLNELNEDKIDKTPEKIKVMTSREESTMQPFNYQKMDFGLLSARNDNRQHVEEIQT